MLLKIFKFTILMIAIVSCATPKKKSSRPLTKKERQLLYYQRLRAVKWDKIRRAHRQQHAFPKPKRHKKQANQQIQKKRPKTSVPKPIPVDPHEQRIEIEQILSFHCMKKRIKDCDQLSTRIYEKCLQAHNPGDKRLTVCVNKTIR